MIVFRTAFLGLLMTLLSTATCSAAADVQHEGFDRAQFNNPFFIHDIEFDDNCCRGFEVRPELDGFAFHLRPNTDFITFDLQPGQRVRSVEVTILDFEGGFAGNRPSSFIAFRSNDDWIGFNAPELGVPFTASATSQTIGRDGNPLGDITQIQLQAANEGNSEFPTEIGAYFDNIIVEVVSPADLIGFEVTTGVVLEGDLDTLRASDDATLHTRSGFGETLVDLHKMDVTVSAATIVDSPMTLNVTTETRISEPAGTEIVFLRNWTTGNFEPIGQHAVGEIERTTTIENIDATNHINGSGEIDVQLRHVVFVPFLAFTFESWIDQVEILVE